MSPSTPAVSPSPPAALHASVNTHVAVAGKDFQPIAMIDSNGPGDTADLMMLAIDGNRAVIARQPQPKGEILVGQPSLGLWSTQGVTLYPNRPSKIPQQVVGAAYANGVIVWTETPSTSLADQPWRAFAVNTSGGPAHLLGDSESVTGADDVPYAPDVQSIATDGRQAWWTAPYVDKTRDNGFGLRVVGSPVTADRREPSVIADHAHLPLLVGGRLVVLRSPMSDPTGSQGRFAFVVPNPKGEEVVAAGPLGKTENIFSACGSPHTLAYAVASSNSERGVLHIRDLTSGSETLIQLDDAAVALDLGCSDEIVAWGNGSGNGDPGQYVYDRRRSVLLRLGEVKGRSMVSVAGRTVIWATPPAQPKDPTVFAVATWL